MVCPLPPLTRMFLAFKQCNRYSSSWPSKWISWSILLPQIESQPGTGQRTQVCPLSPIEPTFRVCALFFLKNSSFQSSLSSRNGLPGKLKRREYWAFHSCLSAARRRHNWHTGLIRSVYSSHGNIKIFRISSGPCATFTLPCFVSAQPNSSLTTRNLDRKDATAASRFRYLWTFFVVIQSDFSWLSGGTLGKVKSTLQTRDD